MQSFEPGELTWAPRRKRICSLVASRAFLMPCTISAGIREATEVTRTRFQLCSEDVSDLEVFFCHFQFIELCVILCLTSIHCHAMPLIWKSFRQKGISYIWPMDLFHPIWTKIKYFWRQLDLQSVCLEHYLCLSISFIQKKIGNLDTRKCSGQWATLFLG